MCRTLKALQKLVKSADYVGQALVPYYRFLSNNLQHLQLSPTALFPGNFYQCSTFSSRKTVSTDFVRHFVTLFLVNIGDGIDYHQRHSENVGDLIQVEFSHLYQAESHLMFTTGNSGTAGEERRAGCLHQHQIHDPHLRVLYYQETLSSGHFLGNKF